MKIPSGRGTRKTSFGLDERFEGLLAYSLGWVSGLLMILFERKSRFVRFHALQSLTAFLLLFCLMSVPFFGPLLTPFLTGFTVLLWVVLMYQAYHGKAFRLPLVGEFAAKELDVIE